MDAKSQILNATLECGLLFSDLYSLLILIIFSTQIYWCSIDSNSQDNLLTVKKMVINNFFVQVRTLDYEKFEILHDVINSLNWKISNQCNINRSLLILSLQNVFKVSNSCERVISMLVIEAIWTKNITSIELPPIGSTAYQIFCARHNYSRSRYSFTSYHAYKRKLDLTKNVVNIFNYRHTY